MNDPPVCELGSRVSLWFRQSRASGVGWIASHDSRMNLMIAVQQFAAVIDIRSADRASTRERNRAGCTFACASVTAAGIGPAQSTVLVIDAVASRDAIPEVEEVRVRASAIKLRLLEIRQYPDADAIAVRYPARLVTQIQHMIIPRLTSILDVHTEQARARFPTTFFAGPVAHTGEGDLIGGRPAWFRSGEPITRVADSVDDGPLAILAGREI